MVAPNRGWQGKANITNTTAAEVGAAPQGNQARNYVKAIQVQNKHATVATVIRILSGTTVIWEIHCPAVQTIPGQFSFDPPLKGAFNEAINVNNVTTGSDVLYNVQGFVGN